jgi:hypothetical protein
MNTARRILRVLALSLVPGALGLGCGGSAAVTTKKGAGERAPERQDPLATALSQLRQAEDRQAEDSSACRDALHQVERHLEGDAEGKRAVQAGYAALRKLRGRLGLDADELEEASGTAFQPLDAQHVNVCLQLRELTESLELQGLPPLTQATEAFGWVVRNVTLRAGYPGVVLPPQVTLRVGEGTADERAVLFLALLQQLDIDGCMLAVPGEGPGGDRTWIPGALIKDAKSTKKSAGGKAEIYLFDTRLGVPVPGPGGEGVATLRQVRAQPGLLARLGPDKDHPYDVTPAQAAAAEVRLVLPLSALAPRMLYLEELLARRDRVRVALDPARLLRRFEEAAGGKVGVWNRPARPGLPPPWTPTRAARLFLPPEEGGLDRSRRWFFELRQEVTASAVVGRNYRELIAYDDLPKEARDRLRDLAERLFRKYVLSAQDRMSRGRLDDAMRRLSRINAVVQDFRRAAPAPQARARAVAEWSMQVRKVYLAVARNLPSAPKQVEDLWSEDQYILALAEPSEEEAEPPSAEQRAVGFLVLGAAADPLDNDAVYRLALCWQEKAARLRADLAREPGAGRQDALRGAWDNARDLAREYAGRHGLGPADVRLHLQAVLAEWRAADSQPGIAIGLWDYLFRDFRRAAAARLIQARALREAGQDGEARQVLRKLADEVAALRQNKELRGALAECLGWATQFPAAQQALPRARLERLTGELGPGGSLAWLEQGALLGLR